MKPRVPWLLSFVAFIPVWVNAQSVTFSNLYTFPPTASSAGTNAYGANPQAGVLQVGNTLYGTTYGGGTYGWGTVFKMGLGATNPVVLHSFNHADGGEPLTSLTLISNALYGTTSLGGPDANGNAGTLFKINLDGSGFTNLFSFTSHIASTPRDLLLVGDTFYGTATGIGYHGYDDANGVIFKLQTDGSNFTVLTNFSFTNGQSPAGGLVLVSNVLYGTTSLGGSAGNGTIFRLNLDGTQLTTVYDFNFASEGGVHNLAGPFGTLVVSAGKFYGTTQFGGSNIYGSVFRVNIDGSSFTNLHEFAYADGAYPLIGLAVSNGTLYGTTTQGGTSGGGVAFAIKTDGTGLTVLHNFNHAVDSGYPMAPLLVAGNSLYGTASSGGPFGGDNGSLFAINLPAAAVLSFQRAGNTLVLSWTNAAFSLQSSTAVGGPYQAIPAASSPYSTRMAGPSAYFRLQGN
jgi:uncharacterized repeat protein (TIGR03803 family)